MNTKYNIDYIIYKQIVLYFSFPNRFIILNLINSNVENTLSFEYSSN